MTLDLGALKRLEREATKGPWAKGNTVGYVYGPDVVVATCGDFTDKELVPFNGKRWNADADLIVAQRTALPKLIEEYEAMVRQRDALAEAIGNAAVRAGICRGDAQLTGPHLLMLADDLATAALSPKAVQKETEG
jgi:hypothetical protein